MGRVKDTDRKLLLREEKLKDRFFTFSHFRELVLLKVGSI